MFNGLFQLKNFIGSRHMKRLKIVAIAAALLALAVVAYRAYTDAQHEKARLEQDARRIADMLKQTKPKE